MDPLRYIAILVGTVGICQAQLIINEIMYNPPETGPDQLEFIEFFNNSNQNVSIKDYKIQDAVTIVFPDTFIAARSYFVIAVNAAKFDSVFGFRPLEWTSGALRNDSELITLLDQNGNVVDSVRYFDGGGWPAEADGGGHSIELCRASADNSQSVYWKASPRNTGIKVEGKFVYASPGALNTAPCAEYVVNVSNFKFEPAVLEIFVGNSVEFKNLGGTHNINGSKTTFPSNPESFGNGSPSSAPWSYIKQFTIVGTYQYQSDLHSSQMRGTIHVKPRNEAYPNYPIGRVTSVNSEGVADSLGVSCTLEGVVYGINLRPSGLQFTIIDRFNDGIGVFSASRNYGYSVKEGDLITIQGVIDQFNGLIQILPDTIIKISSGNPLFNPTNVAVLNEDTESQLVKLRNVQLVNQASWTNNPNGFTVKVTDGFAVFDVRIDNDVDLVSKPAPTGKFDITGIGGQFDPSHPYLDGYQILPRYLMDINPYVPGGGPSYPKYGVARVTTNNSLGVADSLGVRCELSGVVHGVDLIAGNGLFFTLIDSTGGIGVFNAQNNFGYIVREGDHITVRGRIDQYRGLTQMAADTIIKNSENNPTAIPRFVSVLDESTESELVEMRNMTIVNPAEWKADGTSFSVTITNGISNFVLRIHENTETSILSYRGNRINVRGIGSQFDPTEPYTEGYQLIPRYNSDISWLTGTDDFEKPIVHLIPNPVRDKIIIRSEELFDRLQIYSLDGKIQLERTFENEIPAPDRSGYYFLRLLGKINAVIPFIKL